MKEVLPKGGKGTSAALVFLNRRTDGTPVRVSAVLRDLGLAVPSGYLIKELFDGQDMGFRRPDDTLTVLINPSGMFDWIYLPAASF